MSAVNLANIVGGAAVVKFKSGSFYAREVVDVRALRETVDIRVDRFVRAAPRMANANIQITLLLAGEFENLSTLFPAMALSPGALITTPGVGDSALIVHTEAGKKITFHNCAVVGQPDLIFSATETIFAVVTFEAFPKNNTARATANSIYTIEDEALSDTTFAPGAVPTQAYAVAWGASSPWSSMTPRGKISASFPMELEEYRVDGEGVLSRRFIDCNPTARFQPIALTEANVLDKLAIQGTGNGIGSTPANDAMNITGTGVYVRIYGATLQETPMMFTVRQDRVGELVWNGVRNFTSGAADARFFVGTASP